MQFFKVNAVITNAEWAEENDDRNVLREKIRKISMNSVLFNRKLNDQGYYFVVDAAESTVTVGVLCRDRAKLESCLSAFFFAIGLRVRDAFEEEVTLRTMRNMLRCADRAGYIDDDDAVLERFELDDLADHFSHGVDFAENMIEEKEKEAVYEAADRFLARESFLPELDRIYASAGAKRAAGHPVHYFIQTDDRDTRRELYRLRLGALYKNGRIESRRYCWIDFKPGAEFSSPIYDLFYKSCIGGAVVVRYLAGEETEDDCASSERETIEVLCETMRKYRNRVLTVFCLPRECTKAKELFYEKLGSTSFVELKEEFVSGDRAKRFLKMLAKDNGVRADKALFAKLREDENYLAVDLHDLFDEWYDRKLKTSVYPQYKEIATVRREIAKAAPKGNAYQELGEMIGLAEAKKVIAQALDYYKAQKLFARKGMQADRPAMHMVFTGNPGTAKTSAARLFARIMKENGLLSKGKLIEVGRGDLVGKYVGWTAPTIQKKFREAQGSVLFIDEAYSLVDDRSGSYGDEAINTIVQEMENHRDDVVVIFAGYPDEMERFLQKNPGLRSRIAFHVPFADYGTEELCEIADRIAGQKGLKLTDGAREKLAGIFETARKDADFGNGRYVRNAIEKARMAQATRLLRMDLDRVGRSEIETLCAEDIETPPAEVKSARSPIGFRAAG